MSKQIEIFELQNTWGCAWREPGGKIHYGFDGLPPSAKLWLECIGGDAVRAILKSRLGKVIRTFPGAYGGECRTLLVDVVELEASCRVYWDRANARESHREEETCHYCGQRAVGKDIERGEK